uniref:NYD-SP28 domain-containing protein n=1 Tax=Mesocestoides corti TaxID=53468 RepID=A0A5K3FD60_MESCO
QKDKLEDELQTAITNNENCKNEIARGKQRAAFNKEQTEDRIQSFGNWQNFEMISRTEKAKLLQRLESCSSEKKEFLQEQTKLKWEKDNAMKQLKKCQMQMEIL